MIEQKECREELVNSIWKDAMAHCTEDVKRFWTQALREKGVEI